MVGIGASCRGARGVYPTDQQPAQRHRHGLCAVAAFRAKPTQYAERHYRPVYPPMPVQEVEDGMAVAPNPGLCDTAQPGA